MIKMKLYNLIFLLVLAFIAGCGNKKGAESQLSNPLADSLIDAMKATYAPDSRVAVFSVAAKEEQDKLILTGETDKPAAKQALLEELNKTQLAYVDSIYLLPDTSVGQDTLGVVSISVANIRSQPKHSAELATQATMGMPLRILKKEGDWHLVQTPDKYISWIQGSFQPMDKETYDRWQKADKLIFKEMYGFAYQDESRMQTVSDLVAGDVMELLGENNSTFWVRFPDGREAYVLKEEAEPFNVWLTQAEATEETLVNTALKMMGIPYLWGGTSPKAADCSGFTKTVYFMNGKVLPRDASQQVHAGELVDESRNFDKLRPGDLLFFGRSATDSTRERVTHVGMWIGNNEFIHSPGLEAHVRISSVDPEAENYDAFNLNRYLRTKRMINSRKDIIALRDVKLF